MSAIPHPLPAAILFDLDGTLIDSEHLWWEAEVATMASFGVVWTRADQEHCLGGPLDRVARYMAAKAGESADAATAPTAEAVGDALLSRMESLLRERPLEWRPGARDLVRSAQSLDIPLALVSASYRRLLDAVAEAVRQELPSPSGRSAFAVTVAGDEVADGKPHPRPFLDAAAALSVPIEGCIVIEDSPTGVAAGQASGAFVVAVPHLVPIDDAPRRRVLTTLVDVTPRDLARWLAEDGDADSATGPRPPAH